MAVAEGVWWGLLVALVLQRGMELRLSARNEAWLRSQGAREHGRPHYPLFFLLHGGWLLGWAVESRLQGGPQLSAAWPGWVALLILAQSLRYGAMRTLGRRWTTRILVLPGTPPIRRGPYRILRHPNYAAVVLELLAIPMLLGAWVTALVAGVLNLALLLGVRIPVEERALARSPDGDPLPERKGVEQGARTGRSGWAGWADRALNLVERAGNRLPDPITLFVVFILLVLVLSRVASALGVSAEHPGTGEEIRAVDLLTGESIRRILIEMPRTFADFPPLGLVLVVMIGIGVAERTGLIESALKAFVRSMPGSLVTASLVLGGLLSSLAVDAGYVVLIPLGAVLFHGMGRHPIAGLAAAFAGVSGGFSANLLLTGLDPLLAGFTEPAAQLLDPTYRVDPTANWWLMAALVPIFTLGGTVVTERILEPRLGPYTGGAAPDEGEPLTPLERKGLWWAGATVLAMLAVVAWWAVPEDGVLRGPDGDIGPLLSSIVALMLFVFFLPGLVFGLVTGRIRNDRDVASMTSETMASMGVYIILAFVAAHFIAFFNWSNLGLIFAISGADGLRAVGFTGLPLIVSFVLVSAGINLFIGSASAKWAIMAPVFVPMLMLLGYSPELTQAAYRIGDSFTNILTPLLPYYPLVIVFARKYEKDIGLGTLISAMLPYSVVFALTSIPMLLVWIWLGIPLGPGAPLEYLP